MLSTVVNDTGGGGPLRGLRVIDAGNMIAGPMASTLLADYGADVIKIEHPALGDPLRDWHPKREDVSLWWKVTGRNKRLITLDLSHKRGQELFLQLVDSADVLVENFRPGTFERWGLDFERLHKRNPSLVFLRISGFGQTGPYRDRPGYGTVAEAMSGIPEFTGYPDGPPILPGFPLADSTTGVFGALGVMAAIYSRDQSPDRVGQEIDLALYEGLFRMVESQVIGYDQLKKVKRRVGNRLEEDAPRNAYRSLDDTWIAISASSNRTWRRLAEAIGRPEVADDPRFATSSKRVDNVEELDEMLADWFRALTADDALKRLEEHDVVAGPILSIEDIFRHEQYRFRSNIISVSDDDFGEVRMQAPVPAFSATPAEVRFAGRGKGHDNEEIYLDLLGLSPDDYESLQDEDVI